MDANKSSETNDPTEDMEQSPIILPTSQEEPEKPGVLDGVENRIVLIFADDGNIQFAIGKACGADRLIQGSFMLNRIANQMITNQEMQQAAEIKRTAAVMQGLRNGGRLKEPDPWRP